jgi:hypothetical protein
MGNWSLGILWKWVDGKREAIGLGVRRLGNLFPRDPWIGLATFSSKVIDTME